MTTRSLLLLTALTLAACSRQSDGGTSITLNSDGASVQSPQFSGSLGNGTGAVKIDVPGFKGELKLPKVDLDADNFSLNGVHLYPGSAVSNVDVGGGGADGGVRVRFSSPAAAPAVRDWFKGRLEHAGFTLQTSGNALVGTDEDGKPFRMELNPDGADRTQGLVTLG